MSAVSALSLYDGIAFPQLIATADGVRVIEVAARIAAGQMADLVSYGTGINLFEIAFAQAIGDDVPDRLVTRRFTRPLAIRFLTASPGVLPVGTITSIGGLDRVRSAPGVLAADLYIGPGATVRPVQVDADRSGYVIATAGDALEALELADRASELLVVQVEGRSAARVTMAAPLRGDRRARGRRAGCQRDRRHFDDGLAAAPEPRRHDHVSARSFRLRATARAMSRASPFACCAPSR